MKLIVVSGMILAAAAAQAAPSVSEWTPIYRGIDYATGTNPASYAGTLSMHAYRVDLQEPDIRLFITPPVTNNYVEGSRETLLQTPSEFLSQYQVQVAINAVYFSPSGYNLPSGTPVQLLGVTISEGRRVSSQTASNDAQSAILFTTNNTPYFVPINWPPTNTAGIYNAVAGLYPLLLNGVNIGSNYLNALGETIHQPQPRTGFGVSADGRYLFLMTIDGRGAAGDGAVDYETADFLLLLGAAHGMAMDGGGSTCLVKGDVCNNPIELNDNSFQYAVGRPGAQRPIGCNFGVYAPPLNTSGNPGILNNVAAVPGRFSATIRWTTASNALSQVEYGLTENRGTFTPLDSTPSTNHSVTLNGLLAGTPYYFRAIAIVDGVEYSQTGCFSTTNVQVFVFGVTNRWRYTAQNLDGINWKAVNYNDSTWLGPSPGLFYCDVRAVPPNPLPFKSTSLPTNTAANFPYVTYYFRTHFSLPENPAGVVLILTNYLDDGAAYYLNGAEIARAFMPFAPNPIYNSTTATGYFCGSGDANCPYVITNSTNLAGNLVTGDNVLAVEVHNFRVNSPDVSFGAALSYYGTLPPPPPPPLVISWAGGSIRLTWTGLGFTLQRALSPLGGWTDIAGTATTNQFVLSPTSVRGFFRLRSGP